MKLRITILIILGLLIAAFGLWQWLGNTEKSPTTFQASTEPTQTTVLINGKSLSVELAETEEEKATGLSFRENLAANTGMLFIFDEPLIPTFWMREMKFPLDIIWVSQDFKIVDITKNAPVPTAGTKNEDLPLYSPKTEAKYVLEINAGESAAFSIGDIIQIQQTNQL